MKFKFCFYNIILILVFILVSSLVFAQGDNWIDGTHLFDEEVRKLVKTVKLETISDRAKRTGKIRLERKSYSIGHKEVFWTKNIKTDKYDRTSAILKAIGKNCYIFLEEGKTISKEAIENIKNKFDNTIYPINTSTFGSEWKPGVDGDNRITLLLFDIKDGYTGNGGYIAGYFFAGDEYLNSEMSSHSTIKSNEREMFYLDIEPCNPEKEDYMKVIAHEFQHMIHFHQDPSEYTWVNEACSQIAPYLCGFGHAPQISDFKKTPDNSLTAWSRKQMLANYGQVYLWNYYIYNRFLKNNLQTEEFFRKLVSSQEQGIKGYNSALEKVGTSFSGTFHKFAKANFLNSKTIGKDGEYYYDDSLLDFRLSACHFINTFPAEFSGEVSLWGADAIEIDLSNAKSEIEFSFQGFLGTFAYYYENEFNVTIVLQDTTGKLPAKIDSITIRQLKERKLQGGSKIMLIEKGYDKALMIICASFDVQVDDIQYSQAKPMTYKIKVVDAGKRIVKNQMINVVKELINYQTIASSMRKNDIGLLDQFSQLENIRYRVLKTIRSNIEISNVEIIEKISEAMSSKVLDTIILRPILSEIITLCEFQINHRHTNTSVLEIVDTLRNSLKK